VHDVVIAVDGELAPQPVGGLGRAEQTECVDEHDIEAIGVEQQPRPDERAHSYLNEPHSPHIGRGVWRQAPQLLQRWKRNSRFLQKP